MRFFWVPIMAMVAYEVVANARIGNLGDALVYGLLTGGIGGGIWGVLYVVLQLVNLWIKISRAISDVNQVHQDMFDGPFSYPSMRDGMNGKVVEGSIEEIKSEEQKQ